MKMLLLMLLPLCLISVSGVRVFFVTFEYEMMSAVVDAVPLDMDGGLVSKNDLVGCQ
jgi:hypothetical protein